MATEGEEPLNVISTDFVLLSNNYFNAFKTCLGSNTNKEPETKQLRAWRAGFEVKRGHFSSGCCWPETNRQPLYSICTAGKHNKNIFSPELSRLKFMCVCYCTTGRTQILETGRVKPRALPGLEAEGLSIKPMTDWIPCWLSGGHFIATFSQSEARKWELQSVFLYS